MELESARRRGIRLTYANGPVDRTPPRCDRRVRTIASGHRQGSSQNGSIRGARGFDAAEHPPPAWATGATAGSSAAGRIESSRRPRQGWMSSSMPFLERGCCWRVLAAPEGRPRVAQGASPGFEGAPSRQPRRGDTALAGAGRCVALTGLGVFVPAIPGLTPRAELGRPVRGSPAWDAYGFRDPLSRRWTFRRT